MQQRWLRTPVALFQGGILTYAFNLGIMKHVYLNDLKELKMEKYFSLDLDADMMRQDLKDMGIDIEGKYYSPPVKHSKQNE